MPVSSPSGADVASTAHSGSICCRCRATFSSEQRSPGSDLPRSTRHVTWSAMPRGFSPCPPLADRWHEPEPAPGLFDLPSAALAGTIATLAHGAPVSSRFASALSTCTPRPQLHCT